MAATDGKPANVYIHRQAGTPKSCFVCHKASPHVLVSQSIPTLDFLYVCHAHLADRHFATKLSDPTSSSSSTSTPGERLPDKVSQDEIAKIKAEYEAKLKAKETAKDKDADKSKPLTAMGVAGSVFSTVTSTVSGLASSAMSSIPTEAAQTTATTAPSPTAAESLAKQHPLHAKYALHREFYAARVREWNNKMVKKKEKELNMPPAPRNALS